MARMPGRLRVVAKHFPFHPSCNASVLVPRDQYARSCQAAQAAEAVRSMGGAQPAKRYAELLFEAPEDEPLDDERLVLVAGRVGVGRAEWQAAYASGPVRDRIIEDIAEGRRLGVEAVPTFFLDGRRLEDIFIAGADAEVVDCVKTSSLWRRLGVGQAAGGSGAAQNGDIGCASPMPARP